MFLDIISSPYLCYSPSLFLCYALLSSFLHVLIGGFVYSFFFVKIAVREQFFQNTVGVSYGGIWKETNQNNKKKQFQALK